MQKVATHVDVVAICLSGTSRKRSDDACQLDARHFIYPISFEGRIMIQTYQNNCGTYWFQNSPQCSEPNNVDGMCNERDAAASRLLLANSSSKVIGSPRLVKMRSPLLRENLCLFSRKHRMHRA